MNAQFKKGVLELCVLSLLKKGDAYGYELAERLSKAIEPAEGTVYPLLRKLKEDGLCETYMSDASGGPPRKYYRITEAGRKRELELGEEWFDFVKSVGGLVSDDEA
ncbi:MAG: PadR family transcriptional regulator [Clostridiaceae bacterium]|nr:PadR family transcriptional regulator [Eubacteriales bacterium]